MNQGLKEDPIDEVIEKLNQWHTDMREGVDRLKYLPTTDINTTVAFVKGLLQDVDTIYKSVRYLAYRVKDLEDKLKD